MENTNKMTKTIKENGVKMTATILWNDEADKFLSSHTPEIKIESATPIMVIDKKEVGQKLERMVFVGEYGNCLKKQVRMYYRNKKRGTCDLTAYNLALDIVAERVK